MRAAPEIHELPALFGQLPMVPIGIEPLHSRKASIVRREKGDCELESKE